MPRPPIRHQLGAHPNEAARLLWLEMRRRGLSLRTGAEALGINSGLLSRWLFCDGKPGRALSERVREVFGVPTMAWDAPPSETFDLEKLRTGTEG